jgi:hypothetical protein
MATEYDKVLFDQHYDVVLALPSASRWILKKESCTPLEVYCTMYPRSAPQEHFKMRLRWTDYSMPFSLRFVNLETGADNDQHAWPQIDGSRPANFFFCAPFTKEGNDHHPEWANSSARYRTPDEPLVFALIQIQHLLDNTFVGRG